jgi:hypothetical protein
MRSAFEKYIYSNPDMYRILELWIVEREDEDRLAAMFPCKPRAGDIIRIERKDGIP